MAITVNGERIDDARFERDDFGNALGVTLTYNLFAGGLRRAKLREANRRQKETEKN